MLEDRGGGGIAMQRDFFALLGVVQRLLCSGSSYLLFLASSCICSGSFSLFCILEIDCWSLNVLFMDYGFVLCLWSMSICLLSGENVLDEKIFKFRLLLGDKVVY